MPLPEIFWQTLLGLYLLAATVQLVVWWGVFGKLGRWTLDVGRWTLDVGRWTLDIGRKTSDIGRWTLDIGYWTQPISVIICARNEAENLRRYLPAILAQQLESEWELLVVDDASEDETPAVLQLFQEKNPERMRVLRMAEKSSPGKKYALAQGISAAKYDLLLLTDADCEPASPYWLAHMAALLVEKPETEIVLGYGPMRAVSGSESNFHAPTDNSKSSEEYKQNTHLNLWSRYETAFVAAQYCSLALVGLPYMGVGRNLAFKRQVFDRVGGFADHAHILSGDDDLLVNAASNARNTALCLAPDAFVYSNTPSTWSAWLRQKQRHLLAGSAYQWHHKILLAMLGLSQVGFYFLFALLVLVGFAPEIVLSIFILRLFSVVFIFGKILRVLREPGLWWRIPWLDPLMAVYYGLLVPWVLVGKKRVGWGA